MKIYNYEGMTSKTEVIYPYKDMKEKFPDGLSEEWKQLGFKVIKPTMKLINHLGRHGLEQKSWKEGEKVMTATEVNLPELAKYYTHTIIQGWVGMTEDDNETEAQYKPDWLYWHFDHFPFLFIRLQDAYNEIIKQYQTKAEKEESDFFDTSES